MNEIDKKALNNQQIPFKYLNDLRAIKITCEKFDRYDGYVALVASCFNYGVMIGKRHERLKHKA